MTILRVGTSQKYSDGWAAAFGGKKAGIKAGGKATAKKKAPAKKSKKSRK